MDVWCAWAATSPTDRYERDAPPQNGPDDDFERRCRMSDKPIADHALLSDCQSAALVDETGSIEWWCLPRFSSPSVFARILDDTAGHFRVGPSGIVDVERAYLEDSLVLRTTFRTATGSMELIDALAMGEGVRGHELGAGSPHVITARRAASRVTSTWTSTSRRASSTALLRPS
jgi:GH15 family glucan-1,4-alpha-glucosidase